MNDRSGEVARGREGPDVSCPVTGPAFPLPNATPEAPTPTDPRPLPRVAGYEVLTVLGTGGMGTVYQARDVRLGRLVALKLVRPERAGPGAVARFRSEAQAVAQLDHPHIVKVYEVGECCPPEGGEAVPYIALELVPGGRLTDRLGHQPVPEREAARIVQLLARAVQHAHQRGIVHRDLKPDNVLWAPASEEPALNSAFGVPKVTDFGLARRMDLDDRLTEPGVVLGTPQYMAPEQAQGREDVGPAADVWALGAILYRLLAGRAPFEADSAIKLLSKVCEEPVRPLRDGRAGVSAALEAICLRCLEKRPEDRFPSAAALADALREWLEGTDATVDSPAGVAAVKGPARWDRRVVVGALAGGLVVLTSGASAWWRWGRAGAGPGDGGLPAPQVPFKGYIDIVVTRPGDELRQLVRLNDPASRPLRKGDEVRVEAQLNRAAYLYVLWVDTRGEVLPVYPWVQGDWKHRRPERPQSELSLPEEDARGVYPIVPGEPGMETLLLLVRESPLPQDEDLEKLLSGLGAQKRKNEDDLGEVAWFENGLLVRGEPTRGPNLKDVRPARNPVLRLQGELKRRLGGRFAYTRAVTFGNLGGEAKE